MTTNNINQQNTNKKCPQCKGTGEWETLCCNGYKCSCGGEIIPMGKCLCCNGTGIIDEFYDPRANRNSIAGICWIGENLDPSRKRIGE
jgi:hypothetical protein